MGADVTITRKVSLSFDVEKSELKECYARIFKWQQIVHRAANWVITHQYMQESLKDFIYLTDNIKVKLANIEKDEDGILTTSRDNTTYQLLSKHFKGEAPMGMMSGVNALVTAKLKSSIKEIRTGEMSLPTFGKHMPMPVRSADISNWVKEDSGNYSFTVYGTKFKTYFGRDKSGNQNIFDMSLLKGQYKFCDSSIQLVREKATDEKGKVISENGNQKYKWSMYLLAVFSFNKQEVKLDADKIAVCQLGINFPIIIRKKDDGFDSIGTSEEYLHRRNAIKNSLSRMQAACKYNNGGKGREKKMVAIERYSLLEKNYIDGRMHLYSRQLIDYCLKRGIGKIILDNYKDVVEEVHQDNEKGKFLLASWSYFNLSEKIKYKAAKYGIAVEIPADEVKEKKAA